MLVESKRIIPITRLQKELTQVVRDLSHTGEPLFIVKNNSMEAVMVPFAEYEYLTNLEEMFEYCEIDEMVSTRLSTYAHKNNIPWSRLKEE
jgi:PHD/YefM family antitoxin component YafN of YafNO toxin-antitoxin module